MDFKLSSSGVPTPKMTGVIQHRNIGVYLFLTGEKIKVAKEQQIISADINNRLWRLNEQRNELAHTFDKDSLVSRRRFMNDFSTVVATLNRRRNMSAQLLSRYREILNYDNN